MYVWISFFSITFVCTRSWSLRQSYSPGTLDLHLSITIWCWYINICSRIEYRVTKSKDQSAILKKSHIFANFNTCVSDLKINYGGESFRSLPRLPKLNNSFSSFLKFNSIQGVHKWWPGQEVHVHIGSKEMENILSHKYDTWCSPNTQRSPPKLFGYAQNGGSHLSFPQILPGSTFTLRLTLTNMIYLLSWPATRWC